MYIKQILLKIETTASAEKAKQILGEITSALLSQNPYKAVRISIDVDPM